MSGHLYQLESRGQMKPNDYFPVDGPWDRHGYVIKSEATERQGIFLNLIRGTGKTKRNSP